MSLIDILTRLAPLAGQFGVHPLDLKKAIEFLVQFGYLKPELATSLQAILDAIAAFRRMANLPQGGIDPHLLGKIDQPRCGCLDVQRDSAQPARWRKTNLTFFIASYVNGLSQADQVAIIKQAWAAWMAVANFTITQVASQNQADIVISTGRGAAQQFDGPQGTLAYAYLPTGSDQQLLMRFDLDERWVVGNPQGGILMLNVATHEFGHLLGLEHSSNPAALMAPYYSAPISTPQQNDDIPRIQALYGPVTATPTPTPAPAPGKLHVAFDLDPASKQMSNMSVL